MTDKQFQPLGEGLALGQGGPMGRQQVDGGEGSNENPLSGLVGTPLVFMTTAGCRWLPWTFDREGATSQPSWFHRQWIGCFIGLNVRRAA